MTNDMRTQMGSGKGFIAALDQSGGSTPKALSLYGIEESAYSGEQQMYDLVHQMRSRIMTNPAFNGDKVLAAILFEMTMDRDVEGQPTPAYLWNVKRVVPLVKVDLGLADEVDGVQVMKPMPHLDDLCARGRQGCFWHQDALCHQCSQPRWGQGRRRPAVRRRPADPRPRSRADHRARGQHQERR